MPVFLSLTLFPFHVSRLAGICQKKKKNGKTKQLKWLVKSQAEKRAETAFMGPSKMPAYKVIKLLSLCLFFFFLVLVFFTMCEDVACKLMNFVTISHWHLLNFYLTLRNAELPKIHIFGKKKKITQVLTIRKRSFFERPMNYAPSFCSCSWPTALFVQNALQSFLWSNFFR